MPLSGVYPCGERERRSEAPGDYLHNARNPGSNPLEGPAGEKWSEVCRSLAYKGRDTGVPARCDGAMDVTCPECGHGLRAEELPVGDRFGVPACFDEEERSATYAERARRYPGQGAWLDADAPLAAHVLAVHEEAVRSPSPSF